MSVLTMLRTKFNALIARVIGLKRFMNLKTASWIIPAVIIVVGVVVLFTIPVTPTQTDTSDSESLAIDDARSVTAQAMVGLYESGVLPAASTPGREFTLALGEDGSATFVGDYKTGDRLVDETGTWVLESNRLTVTLTTRFGHVLEVPMVYIFEVNEGALKLVGYDLSRWGYMGLTLMKPE